MKKKTIEFELAVFEAEDFENAYANYLKREGLEPKKVSIADMDFALIDYVPLDPGIPEGMGFLITIDEDMVDEFDLFWNEEKEGFYLPGGEYIGTEFWTVNIQDHSVLFDFDVSQFRSFERYVDTSD